MIRRYLSFLLLGVILEGAGHVAVIQPRMTEQDYRSSVSFQSALTYYFDQLQSDIDPEGSLLVVLPEYLGAWLVATNEWAAVFRSSNESRAMIWVILHHPFRFLKHLLHSLFFSDFEASLQGHVQRSIFLTKADPMRDIYQAVFSDLAQTHAAWIVAGSIILPEAEIFNGFIVFRDTGKLMNQSFVFNPRGEVVLVSRKVYPLQEELTFLDPASLEDLTTVVTDLGTLGVLVCADSWYPDSYQALQDLGTDIIAVPSFVTPGDTWEASWKGYDPPDRTPDDIVSEDVGSFPEKAMWEKYALCGRLGISGAVLGANSFLVGSFWGMTGAGQSTLSDNSGLLAKAPLSNEGIILYHQIEGRGTLNNP